MSDNRLENLIAAWLDGRLDAEGSLELQQLLMESSEARSEFRQYALLDTALRKAADTSGLLGGESADGDGGAKTAKTSEAATPFVDTGSQSAGSVQRPSDLSRTRSVGFARVAIWCCAIGALFLLAFPLLRSAFHAEPATPQLGTAKEQGGVDFANSATLRQPPAPIATLAFASDADWKQSQRKVGQALVEGETIDLKQGTARFSVGVGAEIIAEAPVSMTFLTTDRVQLHHGKVAVDVAKWAKGFTVITEDMDLVDLGTKFTVSTSPDAKTEATVLEGVVRVHASSLSGEQRRGRLISEGQHVTIDGGSVVDGIQKKDVDQLLSSLDFGSTEPYRPVVLHNTGLGLSVGDEDQHWRAVSATDEDFSGAQFASVCTPERRYLPNDPDSSQWVSIVDWQTAAPNSTYTFQTEFELKDYDLSTMQLFGRFLADNGVEAVRVNGEPVQVKSWVDNVRYQPFGDLQFRFVNITEGLVEGRNRIEVDVRNGMMRQGHAGELSSIANPMALRVEWYAFGRQLRLGSMDRDLRPLDGLRGKELP